MEEKDNLPLGYLELFYPFTFFVFYGLLQLAPWLPLKLLIGVYIFMFYLVTILSIIESDKFIYRRESFVKKLIIAVLKSVWVKYISQDIKDLKLGINYFVDYLNKPINERKR